MLCIDVVRVARTCVGIFRVWGQEFANIEHVRSRVRGLRIFLRFEVYGVGFANI